MNHEGNFNENPVCSLNFFILDAEADPVLMVFAGYI